LYKLTKLSSVFICIRADEQIAGASNEELIPVESIKGTKLFSGLAYRLHHEYYGQAPIIASEVAEDLQVRGSNSGPWHKFGYRIVAERRSSEWQKYK